MKIFCVIPARDEAKTITEIIDNVKPIVDEVVVINDGSTDQTRVLAETKNITVLSHIINRGQGAALETGNQYALKKGADIVVHFDADGQFLAEEIKEVIAPIKSKEAEIVFGSRFLGKKSNMPWQKKYFIIPLAHLINKIFIGATLTDPQNGFRALSRQAAKKINIEQDGMAHNSEIIFKAFSGRLKIKEVPVTIIYHNFGQRFSGGLKIVKDLILARLIN